MKKIIKHTAFLLCVFVLIPLTVILAYASGSYHTSKINDLTTYATTYKDQESPYAADAGQQTFTVIWNYTNELALLSDPTNEEIDLLYNKGVAVGPLSWIYFCHDDVNNDETVETVYNQQKTIIDGKTLADTDLSAFFQGSADSAPGIHNCYTKMLSAVYSAKLDALRLATDSQTVTDIINTAVSNIQNTSKYYFINENGTNYQTYFEEIQSKVTIQRNRDAITAELREVFPLLYPNDDFTTNIKVSTFRGALQEVSDVADMNTLLNDTVASLLTDLQNGKGIHTVAYLEILKASVANAASDASDSDTAVSIQGIFSSYETDLYRAEKKDELEDYQAVLNPSYSSADKATLASLIDEYNKTGGILDGCATVSDIDLELARAMLRADWFDHYVQTLADIYSYVGSNAELEDDAEGKYLTVDKAIKDAVRTDTVAQEAAFEDGRNKMADLVAEAEALAFKNTHAAILGKENSAIAIEDKPALEQAMDDATTLSPAAAEKLSEILKNNLGEKYKKAVRLEILDQVKDDNCKDDRKASADALAAKLEALSTSDLAALKAEAEALLDKSEHIQSVWDRYNEIVSDPDYTDYKNDFKNSIKAIAEEAAQVLLNAVGDTTESLADKLDRLTADSVLKLDRAEAQAKVTLAANNSTLSDVTQVLNQALADLDHAEDKASVDTIAAKAILDINKCLTTDEMKKELDSLKASIAELDHLSDTEIAYYQGLADVVFDNAVITLNNADNQSSVDLARSNFLTRLENTLNSAVATDLAHAKEAAAATVTDKAQALIDQLNAYQFIDPDTKQAILDQVAAARSEAIDAINGSADVDAVAANLSDSMNDLTQLERQAAEAERVDCLDKVREDLSTSFGDPNDYSDAQYAKIQAIIKEFTDALAKADTVEEYVTLRDNALAKIHQIPNRLEEAQADGEARLKEAYDALMLNRDSYSPEKLSELESIYNHSLAELRQIQNIADTPTVATLVEDRIALMRAVHLDKIYTDDKYLSGSNNTSPEDYDPMSDGYIGLIESTHGIPSGSKLSIQPAEQADVEKLIREAAKQNKIRLANGTTASEDLIKLLKNCEVSAALNIGFGNVSLPSSNSYTVSVLLPHEVDKSNIIGVVYLCEDGSVEYYDITCEEDLIRFTTSHFSNYYVVSERIINLIPVIVILGIIACCEIAAIILLNLRKSRKESEKKEQQEFLASFAIPAFVLTKYRPIGAIPAIILLGAAVLGLGGWIVYLIISERRAEEDPEEEIYPEEEDELLDEPIPVPVGAASEEFTSEAEEPAEEAPEGDLAIQAPEELLQLSAPAEEEETEQEEELPELGAPEEMPALEAAPEVLALEAPEQIPALEAAPEVLGLEAPPSFPFLEAPERSAEEPYIIMTEEPLKNIASRTKKPKAYQRRIRAIMNMDTLSENFQAGDTVTMNALKEKRLIPRNVTYVKILGRGALELPLTVIAQGFSQSAWRMIILSGGTPMISPSSSEKEPQTK